MFQSASNSVAYQSAMLLSSTRISHSRFPFLRGSPARTLRNRCIRPIRAFEYHQLSINHHEFLMADRKHAPWIVRRRDPYLDAEAAKLLRIGRGHLRGIVHQRILRPGLQHPSKAASGEEPRCCRCKHRLWIHLRPARARLAQLVTAVRRDGGLHFDDACEVAELQYRLGVQIRASKANGRTSSTIAGASRGGDSEDELPAPGAVAGASAIFSRAAGSPSTI